MTRAARPSRSSSTTADVVWNHDVQAYIVPLAQDWDTFRAGLKRNVRQSLRKCYNSLKSDGLSFEFECVSDPADLGPALDHFFVLHRLRAEMSDTVQHPDVFASITGRDFLREVTTRLAERGITRVFLLRINGRVVAARIGFVLEDTLYLYCSGLPAELGSLQRGDDAAGRVAQVGDGARAPAGQSVDRARRFQGPLGPDRGVLPARDPVRPRGPQPGGVEHLAGGPASVWAGGFPEGLPTGTSQQLPAPASSATRQRRRHGPRTVDELH